MYKAIVAPIEKLVKHPNADRLQIAMVKGFQVIVGIDVQVGDRGVLFPPDGKLSPEMLASNDLVSRINEDGTRAGGFFEPSGRVKATKLRGVRSDAYWSRLDCLDWTGVDTRTLLDGETFAMLNGRTVCEKYETPATKAAQQQNKKIKVPNPFFPEHDKTSQLFYEVDSIPVGARVILTEKLHGTSQREGLTRAPIKLATWKKAVNFASKKLLGKPWFDTNPMQHVIGTRRTVLTEGKSGYYGNEQFRRDIAVGVDKLLPGEILYYEVVGWVNQITPIMDAHDLTKLKDKTLLKTYRNPMRYSYGCHVGECTIFVYRIIRVDDSGIITELSHDEMIQRCKELGIKHVPVLNDFVYDGNREDLIDLVKVQAEGMSTVDMHHIREGVCLRVEYDGMKPRIFKHKGWVFKGLEGIKKDQSDYVDREEAS